MLKYYARGLHEEDLVIFAEYSAVEGIHHAIINKRVDDRLNK